MQKRTAIEISGRLQRLDVFGCQRLLQHGDVQPMLAGRVELDCLAADEEKGGIGFAVANSAAQAGQCVAQVGARRAVRPVGPQQAGQRIALMGPIALDGQEGQQGAYAIRLEFSHRSVVDENLETTEECQSQPGHGVQPPCRRHCKACNSARLLLLYQNSQLLGRFRAFSVRCRCEFVADGCYARSQPKSERRQR